MITFLFVAGGFLLIFSINLIIRYYLLKNPIYHDLSQISKENLLGKKTAPIAKIGLILLLIGILFINFSSYFDAKQLKNSEINTEEVFIDTASVILPEIPLNAQIKFLRDNGFNEDADFSESQFKEFNSIIETGLFKDVSFCEVFQKSLYITNNSKNAVADLKKLYSKYKKIPYFDTVLSVYGFKVCNPKPIHHEKTSPIYINSDENANPCIISKDFIKQDLTNPDEADFALFDCSTDKNSNGTYTILRKVITKNVYGVKKSYIYKLTIGYKGGNWVDISNWDLIKMQSEEYK